MMDGFGMTGGGMMFGWIWLLLVVALVILTIAALIKYLMK